MGNVGVLGRLHRRVSLLYYPCSRQIRRRGRLCFYAATVRHFAALCCGSTWLGHVVPGSCAHIGQQLSQASCVLFTSLRPLSIQGPPLFHENHTAHMSCTGSS